MRGLELTFEKFQSAFFSKFLSFCVKCPDNLDLCPDTLVSELDSAFPSGHALHAPERASQKP
jgi:hypothetical protein